MDSAFQYPGLCEVNTKHPELVQSFQGNFGDNGTREKSSAISYLCVSDSSPAPQRSTSAPGEPRNARSATVVLEAAGPLEGCLQPSFHGFWSTKPPLHIPDQLQITHGIKQSLEMLQEMHQRAACRGLGRVFGPYQLERGDEMLQCYKVQENWSEIIQWWIHRMV